jgi:gas vesicle protein
MNKFITGLAAGIVLGILFAPAKGSDTRRKLAEKGADLNDRLTDFVDDVADKMDVVKEKVATAIGRRKYGPFMYEEYEEAWTNPM